MSDILRSIEHEGLYDPIGDAVPDYQDDETAPRNSRGGRGIRISTPSPGSNFHDKRAEENRRSYCQPCKRLGVTQVAHRIDKDGNGICSAHFRGELVAPPAPARPKNLIADTPQPKRERGKKPADWLARQKQVPAAQSMAEKKESNMGTGGKLRCPVAECGKELGRTSFYNHLPAKHGWSKEKAKEWIASNGSGNYAGEGSHKRGPKPAHGGASTVSSPLKKRGPKPKSAQPIRNAFTADTAQVRVSEAFLDNLWARLELDEKVAALQAHLEAS